MKIQIDIIYASYSSKSIKVRTLEYEYIDDGVNDFHDIQDNIVDTMKRYRVYVITYKIIKDDDYLVETSSLYVKYMIWKHLKEDVVKMLLDDIENEYRRLAKLEFKEWTWTGTRFQERCDEFMYPILDEYYKEELKGHKDGKIYNGIASSIDEFVDLVCYVNSITAL